MDDTKQFEIKDTVEPTPPDFETITDADNFETSEEACNASNEVETIIMNLKQIQEKFNAADSLVTEMYKKSYNDRRYKRRYTIDEVLTEESNIYEDFDALRKAIDAQLARYRQFAEDCESAMEDLEAQERDDRKYGSYEDQVRWQYNSGRL